MACPSCISVVFLDGEQTPLPARAHKRTHPYPQTHTLNEHCLVTRQYSRPPPSPFLGGHHPPASLQFVPLHTSVHLHTYLPIVPYGPSPHSYSWCLRSPMCLTFPALLTAGGIFISGCLMHASCSASLARLATFSLPTPIGIIITCSSKAPLPSPLSSPSLITLNCLRPLSLPMSCPRPAPRPSKA